MNKCETCGIKYDAKNKSERFCSKTCSSKFSTKNVNHAKLKSATCVDCGVKIMIKLNASSKKCLCANCKWHRKTYRRNSSKLCLCCGAKWIIENKQKKYLCKHPDICNIFRRTNLYDYFSKFKLNIHTIGTDNVYSEIIQMKNIILDEYINNGQTTVEIQHKYKFKHVSCLIWLMSRLNIKRRTISEALSLSLTTGKTNFINCVNLRYKSGKHTSWNGYTFHYRSSHELEFAQMLDKDKINYKYEIQHENKPIVYFDSSKNKNRVCYPDFYLVNENLIVEIKSNYTLNIQEMKDKFKKYTELGYNVKLWLEKQYVDINLL